MSGLTRGLIAFLFLSCITTPSLTEELPKNLFLQCAGNSKWMRTVGLKPEFANDSFSIILHLKDASVMDLTNDTMLGRDCIIEHGEIGCELAKTKYDQRANLTEKRTGIVLLTRATGAIRLLHTTLFFSGPTATGKSLGSEKLQRTGTCRPTVQKPIF